MVAMASFALLLDTCLYLRIAYMMSAKPGILAAMCLGCVPIFVVAGCNLLLQGAIAGTLAINISNPQGRIGEEILAHTYLGLISAVFLPFLVIRLLLQFKSEEA
jgi:uncharacterized membrane protein YeaQ/YmgE (transglycosylase-associated protein family)